MVNWIAFPYDAAGYARDAQSLAAHWTRLHRGDAQPLPTDDAVLAAWALFHGGQFQQAHEAGASLGRAGLAVANQAQCVYANYLETREKVRLAMFRDVAERAQTQLLATPDDASAHYWLGYALGRYSKGVSVAKSMEEGLDATVKRALETTITLVPAHADAHVALGSLHAEIIDTLGKQLGQAQGADAATGLQLLQQALVLNPDSAIARVEYANALVMLEGDRRMKEAEQLYAEAAACTPLDAAQRLDVEMARAGLEDE